MTRRRFDFGPLVAPEIGKGGGPTPFVNSFDQTVVGSLRYNTSQMGQPLPIVYGTQRLSINLLEFWGYMGGNGKGGKGGGPSKSASSKKQVSFSVFIAMGICQGPVSFTGSSFSSGGNNRVWANAGIAYGAGSVGLNEFSGSDGQAPDSVFASQDPNTPVIGYSGTCYVTGHPLQMGQSPSIPNISFEICGFYQSTGIGVFGYADDANPADIISDILTNDRYGAGYPSVNLDVSGTIADFGNYCNAAQLAMSLLLDRCQPAARWVEEITQLTVSAPFFSAGLLKIVPYFPSPIGRSGVSTWTPNLIVQYSLSDADFLDFQGESDPVLITRIDPTQVTNWLGVEYYDSSNAFNPNISYLFDQGAIDEYGLRNEPIIEAHSFTNATSANASVLFMLQRKGVIRNKFQFKLPWVFALLDPMDIVELTDPTAGLTDVAVRITSITEDDDNGLTFEAEDVPGVTAPPTYTRTSPTSVVPNVFVDPGQANAPIIFEPNAPLSSGALEVWILSSGGVAFGGANVWVSTDGTTYALIGTLYSGARQGTLTSALAAYGGANPDTTNTLAVDLTESLGQLNSGSSTDASNAVTLCYCDGELLSYETASLTGTDLYSLTTLYRGLYGTAAGSHSIASNFAYLGLQTNPLGVVKYDYPSNLIGATIHIKLQAFNVFLSEAEDLASCTDYTYTLNGHGSISPVNIPFFYNGIPQSAIPILNYTFGVSDNFALNFSGSVCTSSVAATANTIFTISKNGTNFATLTFAAAATSATFSGAATSFAPGDILKITPSRTDATLANLTGNLAGTS